jgi:hypothetical protein
LQFNKSGQLFIRVHNETLTVTDICRKRRQQLQGTVITIRLALIVVGTAVYLALAVLGWGGLAAFFSHPVLTALAVAVFVMAGASFFAGGNLSPGVREDRGNRCVILVFLLLGLLDAYLPAYTDRKEFWTIDGDTTRWFGVVLFVAGGAPAALAGICARRSVQWACRHPAEARAGHRRYLWCYPPPQLFGFVRQLVGVGPGLSFGSRRSTHGSAYSASPCAHRC